MNQIGKYKVLGELGRGGFGAVYLCEDNLGGQVAIKVFDPKDDDVAGAATSASTDAAGVLLDRFKSEARTLRRLSSNPYIVTLYDFDETDDGIPYYVMPYLEQSLVNEIGRDVFSVGGQEDVSADEMPRPIAPQRAIRVLTEILEAMKTVHSEGLVHRDLKPANILFDRAGPAGKVQVCDFGIAKLPDTQHSQSGVGMGSRNYISPEQRESAKHVEASSDVYAIGSIAYRMLTGTLPAGQFQDPIVYAPSIGQPLNDLIIRSMSIDPAKRPKDGGEYLQELKAALKALDESAPADEVTDTWVEQGEAGLRDDLKPLKERIEKLLLAQGEITPENHETLTGLARIADLDDAELNALIKVVTDEHIGVLKPVQNFLALLDEQVAAGTVKREMLMVAGNAIGWDETRVARVIAGRQSIGEKLDWTSAAKAFFGGRVFIAAIVVVLVSIGGFWVYEQQKSESDRLRSRAEQGDASAQYELGVMYATGEGVPEDDKEAVKWYRLAAEQGNADAQFTLGEMYADGMGVPEDNKEAVKWYRLAADQGLADAQINLGGMYFNGSGVPKDYKETVKWFRLAAEQGDASAQSALGVMYANGMGVPEDDKEAVKWYRLAADQGRVTAQYNLGVMYANGEGVPEDDKEAVKWYRLATDQGDAKAQFNLGVMYANGEGVPEDDKEAAKWYRLAADQGHASAQYNLGVRYANGEGVPEDDKEAAKWYRLAADQGVARVFKDCDVCPEMVVIPSGRFQMGSNSGYSDEKPAHTVTIAKPFALGKTEVTFAEYDAFAQATNRGLAYDEGWGRGSRPVINVDWDDATAYANWLSNKTGKRYRLPSESEWEYAARAGSTTKYSWGDSINCRQARYGHLSDYCGNEEGTAVVGSFSANPFGLQNMHGNVYERTQDCWNKSYSGAPANGSAWTTSGDCSSRVLRGGSWTGDPSDLRSANRTAIGAAFPNNTDGFRLAQDL